MEQPTLMEEKSLKQASEKLKYILKNHHNIPKSWQCKKQESGKCGKWGERIYSLVKKEYLYESYQTIKECVENGLNSVER